MLGKNDSNNWTAFIEHLLYGLQQAVYMHCM